MKEETNPLFANFLRDDLSLNEKGAVEKIFAENEPLKTEFENLKNFYEKLEILSEKETDASMDLDFYLMIEKEKRSISKNTENTGFMKISWLNPTILKYAAGIILILGFFWIGRRTAGKGIEDIKELADLKKDVQETKELVMLSMLKKDSPSERIQAVNYSYEIQEPDKAVIDALIKTLNQDSNINVRTAAAEALSHFGNEKRVREALVQSLISQQEPNLQITIIDILANLGEKRAISPMKKLLQNSETDDFVKRKAQESVKILMM